MYDILYNIIDHVYDTSYASGTEQQIYFYIAGALIIILTVTFIDLIYRVFSHFFRGSK